MHLSCPRYHCCRRRGFGRDPAQPFLSQEHLRAFAAPQRVLCFAATSYIVEILQRQCTSAAAADPQITEHAVDVGEGRGMPTANAVGAEPKFQRERNFPEHSEMA